MEVRPSQDPTLGPPVDATLPAEAPATRAPAFLLCETCYRVHPATARDPARGATCPRCGASLRPVEAAAPIEAPSPGADRAGGVPFGRYLMRRELGRGGMGVVHEAWDTQLSRAVALKMLTAGGGHPDDAASARLLREARSAARLHHPSIVAIHDVGVIEGRPYFTMDLVDGRQFEELLCGDDPWTSFPLRRRVEVLLQVAEALGHAHAEGVVHRDVKPSNVLVDARGRAILMDFGLAKELTGTDLGQDLTVSGAILGTPRYMSPEQAGGGSDPIGPRSDVFSFGILLYRALTGILPFEGQGMEAVFAVLSLDPAPPSRVHGRVHRDLETITMRCLEKDPTRRFADGAELAAELRRWLDGEPILSRPVSWGERLLRRATKRRAALIPAAIAVLLACGLWYALHDRGAQARLAEQAVLDRRGAEGRERSQAEALTLVEQARTAYGRVQPVFYDEDASFDEVLSGVEAAQGLLERATGLCPGLVPAHYLLGLGWEIRGWDDRAEACYRQALAIDPRFGPAHYRLGRLYLQRAYLAEIRLWTPGLDQDIPAAREWAREAEGEVQAALAEESSLEDAVEREVARATVSYARGDHAEAARICDQGLRAHGRATGREELYWLRGIARSGQGPDDSYDQAIAIRPKFALARFCRAAERSLRGDREGALADYSEAIRVSPRFVAAYANRAGVRLTAGDRAGAIADCEAALAIDPRCAAALIHRGYARGLGKDQDGALADYTSAIEADPSCFNAYANRAEVWRVNGDLARALADCEAALRIDPKCVTALVNRGAVRWERGDLAGALDDYQAAVAVDPRSAPALVGRATVHTGRGDLAKAIADLDRAIECEPSSGNAYYNRGCVRQRMGEIEKAMADYTAAIERDPSIFDVWCIRGAIRGWKGDVDGALADVEQALRLRPSSALALATRGGLRSMKGDRVGARADLDEAVRLDPTCVQAWRNRAILRSQTGDATGALADSDEAVRRAPGDLAVRETRGTIREAAGDHRGALEDLDAILANSPRNPRALFLRGKAKVGIGDLPAALADYEAAIEAAPTFAEAYADRGLTLVGLGRPDEARASLEKALDLAPPGWEFRSMVERVLKELPRPK